MSTIYLLTADSCLSKSGGRLIVRKGSAVVSSQPLQSVEAVIVGAKAHISHHMHSFLLQNGCRIYFFDKSGNISECSVSDNMTIPINTSAKRKAKKNKQPVLRQKKGSAHRAVGLAVAAVTAGLLARQWLKDPFVLPLH